MERNTEEQIGVIQKENLTDKDTKEEEKELWVDSDDKSSSSEGGLDEFEYSKKFDINEYDKKVKEQESILSSHGKGRRGIGNYDIFCKSYGQPIPMNNKKTKSNL